MLFVDDKSEDKGGGFSHCSVWANSLHHIFLLSLVIPNYANVQYFKLLRLIKDHRT